MNYRTSLMAAVALGALVAGAGAASADTLGFRPGTADPGNSNRMPVGDAADLNAFVDFDTLIWKADNNIVPPGAPFTQNDQWFIRVADANNNALIDAGESFSESFTFHLMRSELTAGGGSSYGIDSSGGTKIFSDNTNTTLTPGFVLDPSHVLMTFNAVGTFDTAYGSLAVNRGFDLTYTSAEFRMFYDVDGDPGTFGDQTLIAVFGEGDATPGFSDPGLDPSLNQTSLEWDVIWNEAMAGVFSKGGNEIATGGIGGNGLNIVPPQAIKITSQDVSVVGIDNDIELNTIRLRLDAQGSATGESVFEVTAVPEPFTLGVFGAGLLGLGALARRRKAA